MFIDTCAFLARYLTRDQHHARATAAWSQLADEQTRCHTSSFVLDELLTLLGRWTGNAFAAERGRALYGSEALVIVRPTESDELRALGLLSKYADQAVSFTDCVSFALMQRLRLERAFTFDAHFRMAGFEVWPTPR